MPEFVAVVTPTTSWRWSSRNLFATRRQSAGRVRLNGVVEGDRFVLIYRAHERKVCELAFFYLKDHHEAEDAAQETFLNAWRSFASYRGASSEHTWLMAICRNVCIDRLRRRPKGGPPQSLNEDRHAEVRDLRSDHDDPDGRIDLRRAEAQLTCDELEAWYLMVLCGYKSKEAATIVGAPASTMRDRKARALDRVAAALCEAAAPPIASERAGDVRGLFHSSRANAVVVSLADMRMQAASADAARDPSPLDLSFLRMYAYLKDRLAQGSAASHPIACPCLIEFLESLDRNAPADRRLLLLIENATRDIAATTDRWRATHPRWRIHTTPRHSEWKQAFEELFAEQANARQNHGPRGALALIEAAQPFAWSDDQNGLRT